MSLPFTLLAALTTAWVLGGLVAVARIRRRRRVPLHRPPSVSVLKPLCGADDRLEDNLETFFRQDHPEYELVFGVQGGDDPAAGVVRRLRARHPDVPCRLVVHDGGRGVNPKVSNLRAMLEAVRHDVVLVSDSNVAVDPSYLGEAASALDVRSVGLVTHLFAGTGEETTGATVENLHLNAANAGGVALAGELGHPVVVGKSMMFRRSVFERLGGFASVANLLAEDYVIGRMFHSAGYRVHVAARPVRNVCARTTLRAFVRRHYRWGMIRIRMQPLAFLAEPLSMPLLVAALAPLFGVGGVGPLVWALSITMLRDAGQWWLLRGPRGLLRALPLGPLRDVLLLAAWLAAPFGRHVTWRGNRVRVSAGTRLYAERAPTPPGTLRVEEG